MAEEEEALAASLANDDQPPEPEEPLEEKDHESDADVQGQEQPTQGDEEPDQTEAEKEVAEEEDDIGQADENVADDLGQAEDEIPEETEDLGQAEKDAAPTEELGQKHQEVVPTDPEDDQAEEEHAEDDNVGKLEEKDDQAKEADMECEEEHPEEAEVPETEIEKETTPVVQARKGRREPTIPTRTIPSRKAKESVVPTTPQSEKPSPKARRRVEFSPEMEKSADDQAGQAKELPNSTPTVDSEGNMAEPEADVEATEEPETKADDRREADDHAGEDEQEGIEKQRAEMIKAKKGKAKAQPVLKAPKTRQIGRRIGGPVIREPDADHVLIESSDESEDEFNPESSYARLRRNR